MRGLEKEKKTACLLNSLQVLSESSWEKGRSQKGGWWRGKKDAASEQRGVRN